MENCFECRRLELEIQNLEQALDMQKFDAFIVEHSTEENDQLFELILRLTDRLQVKRDEYKRHRQTHFGDKN